MQNPINRFKERLKSGPAMVGIWNTIGGNTVTEALALSGFDFMTIDTEHSPVEVTDVLSALQQVAGYDVMPIVRPAFNDLVLIKRILDFGAQTLLLPYVQNAEEARAAVDAVRYPPAGLRGVSTLTRATRFGRIDGYTAKAGQQICLLVQVETVSAMAQLEEIATVDGVDGVFIGPADLAASMGLPGQPNHPDVKAAVEQAIARLTAVGVPAGLLTTDNDFARRCIDLGARFVAVGIDLGLLVRAADTLAKSFKS